MNISALLAKELVETQFPHWGDLPIREVDNQGHDNRTFRLGEEMSVRLPTGELYALHVGVEHDWLPVLAPRLPQPIPEPVGKGTPGCGYPWPWSINCWISGEVASMNRIGALEQFASDLAGFLNALQRVDASGGPFAAEDITGHEFAHAIINLGFTEEEMREWMAIYEAAKVQNAFPGTFAMTNADEYFAELSQSYFEVNNEINGRREIRRGDPDAFRFLEQIYGRTNLSWPSRPRQ